MITTILERTTTKTNVVLSEINVTVTFFVPFIFKSVTDESIDILVSNLLCYIVPLIFSKLRYRS